MSDDTLRKSGVNLPESQWESLNQLARDMESREVNRVSRSEAAREVVPIGLAVWDAFETQMGDEWRRMAAQDRRAMARQAAIDFVERQYDDGE